MAEKKKAKTKTLWERIKEGYTTIRELARAGKPKEEKPTKEGEKPRKRPGRKLPTTEEIIEIRRKAKVRADEAKRKVEARKRQAPLR